MRSRLGRAPPVAPPPFAVVAGAAAPSLWAEELELDADVNEGLLWCGSQHPLAHALLGIGLEECPAEVGFGLQLYSSCAAAHHRSMQVPRQ